jgi:hypothetical protein
MLVDSAVETPARVIQTFGHLAATSSGLWPHTEYVS